MTTTNKPRLALGGDGAAVVMIGTEKVGRIRERGFGKYDAAMQDGSPVGTFTSRKDAALAILAVRG
jgi:hypothetical protein